MSTTQAAIGYLATLSIGDSSSPIGYTAVAELKTIKPNIATVPVIDATHLLSPSATEEMLPGLNKPGTLDFTGNFTGDATQLSILSNTTSRTVFPFKVTWKTAAGVKTATLLGQGFFTKFEIGSIEPSKLVEFDAAMQITGANTLAAA
jgi:hypothetical protein